MNTQYEKPRNPRLKSKKDVTLYLEDGTSKIDGILVYNVNKGVNEVKSFIKNLKETGLILESVPLESRPDLIFVKIHAPNDVLLKYADLYGTTFRKDINIIFPQHEIPFAFLVNVLNSPHPNPDDPICKRAWETISKQPPTVITSGERSVVVFQIMDYIQFGHDNFDVGVRQLLHKNIILDAYPLHDGPWEWSNDLKEPINDRQLLAAYWASFSMFFKQQPLDTVKNYYGYEIAIYFAWLGFYNKMLVYAAILGIISFVGGLIFINAYSLDHIRGYCNHTGVLCNKMLLKAYEFDNLEKISSTCPYVYVTYTNSNLVTFVYSALIVLWCTIFKEGWKREYNVHNAKWDNPVFEDFVLRPQFIANATQTRPQMYTGEPELYITFSEQFCRFIISILGTLIMISFVIGSLVAVVYLESLLTKLHYPRIQIIMLTTGCSLASMIVLEIIFNNNLLKLLAKLEMPRTELDYEKSIIIKSLIFLSLNSYGRLLYIAFFKGKHAYYYSVFSKNYVLDHEYPFPSEYCMPPSCVFEVICLLGAILILKPIILNIIQLLTIFIYTKIRRIILSLRNIEKRPRWECDYALNTLDRRYILNELNKLIIQFGFVSFFAASCPLAPLVALIYNLMSVRADATKIVKFYKRPIERKQVTSIGICFDIFETMAYVAIIINALSMAYTCRFIHMFLFYTNRTEQTDPVVVNEYAKMEFEYKFDTGLSDSKTCFIQGFYEDTSNSGFQLIDEHYDFLNYKANLALAFMLAGFFISAILSYVIPDVPRSLLEFIHFYDEGEKNKEL